jgi:hypothetical protein
MQVSRYLLQQWTVDTIAHEERLGSHGVELWVTPSTSLRLLDLATDDVIFVAAVVGGRLLPVGRFVVDWTATYDDLVADGHDPYPLPYQALAKPPLPRMNLRAVTSEGLSLAIRKDSGEPLARRKRNPRQLDGQGFRTPQWIDEASAEAITAFLDGVWEDEDEGGVNDPVRVSRGLAPRLSADERRAIERRAMDVVETYYAPPWLLRDVSTTASWDFTGTHPTEGEVHIEVKGTTGTGHAVTVTAGERRHAGEFARPALAIVTGIALTKGTKPSADGGKLSVHLDPWDPTAGAWAATVYRYEPPR